MVIDLDLVVAFALWGSLPLLCCIQLCLNARFVPVHQVYSAATRKHARAHLVLAAGLGAPELVDDQPAGEVDDSPLESLASGGGEAGR